MDGQRLACRGIRLFLACCGASALLLVSVLAVQGAGCRGSWSTTDYQMLNLAPYPQIVTAHFFAPSGAEVFTETHTLLPGASLTSQAESQLPAGFIGTLYLDAPGAVAMGIVHLDQMLEYDGNEIFPVVWDENLRNLAYTPIDLCTILRIHNLGISKAAAVQVYLYRPDGMLATQMSPSIPPQGLVTVWPAISPDVPPDFAGAAVIHADQTIEVTVLNVCDGLAAYVAPAGGDTSLWIPRLSPRIPAQVTTTIALQNTSGIESTEGHIAFSSGQTTTFSLNPYGSIVIPSPYTNTTGSAVVVSAQPVVAVVRSSSSQLIRGSYAYVAFAQGEFSQAVALPVLFSGYEGWETGNDIWVRNMGPTTATVRIRFVGAGTDEALWERGMVGPGQTWQVMLPPMAADRAAAIILADQPIVALAGATKENAMVRDSYIRYRGSNFTFDCQFVDGPNISWKPSIPSLGQTTTLTATALAGNEPISYTWSLGDGSTAEGMVVTHTYMQTGWQTVTLTATNCLGFGQEVTTRRLFVRSSVVYLPLTLRARP